MRLCANLSWMFGEHPFLDRFEAAAKAGFKGVEILSPYEHPVAELKSRLDASGVQLILVNSPSGDRAAGERGMACIPGREAEFRSSIMTALEYASALGCGMIHVMAGVRAAGVSDETASALYAINLAWAVEQSASAGVKLIIEAINQGDIPGYHLRTQEQAAAVIAATDEQVGLQFDIYHCQTSQGNVARRLEALFPLISHVQVADVPSRTEPGTGEVGWEYLFSRIAQLGYTGWIGCEYKPATTTLAGLAWRDRLLPMPHRV
jgi:hydroxypyruvate isomerase